jgi:branched-chain amino acid transport system permease protein
MDLLLQLLVIGISQAAVYALIATGFGLILAVNHIFHFAHAAVFALAGFLVYFFVAQLELPWLPGLLLAAAGAVGVALLIHFLVYERVGRSAQTGFTVVLASIGLQLAIENICALIWGTGGRYLPDPLPDLAYGSGTVTLTLRDIVTVAVAIVGVGGTLAFLRFTETGHAMRAYADNPVMARVVGINPTTVGALAIGIATLLAVPAAVITGWYSSLVPAMGLEPLLYSVAAVVVGGIGSVLGACLGAVILGVFGALVSVELPAFWSDTFSFIIMMLCVLWFPSGLLGVRSRSRATR